MNIHHSQILYTYIYIWLLMYIYLCVSRCVNHMLYLCIQLIIYLPMYSCIYLCISLSTVYASIQLSMHLSIYLSVSLSVYPIQLLSIYMAHIVPNLGRSNSVESCNTTTSSPSTTHSHQESNILHQHIRVPLNVSLSFRNQTWQMEVFNGLSMVFMGDSTK